MAEKLKYKKKRLNSIPAIRRYLAQIISRVDGDDLDAAKGGRIGYLLNILISSHRESEIEKRISQIESVVEEVLKRNV